MIDNCPNPADALAVPVRIHRSAAPARVKQRGRDVVDISPFVLRSDRNFVEWVEVTGVWRRWVTLQHNTAELLPPSSRKAEILALDVHHHDTVRPREKR